MMPDQKYIYTVIWAYLCFTLPAFSAAQACDRSKCRGPVRYYQDLRCTPIYRAGDTCCAVRYNCDNLKARSADKCYAKDNVYNIGEQLKDEDAEPCDVGCTCSRGSDGRATFNCAIVDCFTGPVKPGCYRKRSPFDCCPGEEVCPENAQDRARCVVDGRTYLDGEAFIPNSDPTLRCFCQPGYVGENVEPFCRSTASRACGVELRNAGNIYNNCTPVFNSNQNPAIDCSVSSRCQNSRDRVVRSGNANSGSTCQFGRLTMNIGDQLNSETDSNSGCIRCVCEVPPRATCRRLPANQCNSINVSISLG